jgi:Carboxypeptidase regulatory-like domain
VHRTFRFAASASVAGLLTAGLLAIPALASASPPGQPRGAAAHAAALPLSAQQMRADSQANARAAQPIGSVTGLAESASGRPLANVCVTAYGPSGTRLAVSDTSGRYFIGGLRAGAYYLHYQSCDSAGYLPEWYGGAAERADAHKVLVGSAAVQSLAPVTLRAPGAAGLARAAAVSTPAAASRPLLAGLGPRGSANTGAASTRADAGGRIAGIVTGPNGRPLAGICAEAYETSSPYGYALARTAKTGRYRTSKLPAGTYQVAFVVLGCGSTANWLPQIYKDIDTISGKPTPVRVRSGQTTSGIDAKLQLGGEISGTITGAGGARLSGICVAAEMLGKAQRLFIGSAQSSRGAYHLHGMPAGPYKILFLPCGRQLGGYLPIWWDGAQSERAAKVIRLKSRQLVSGINEVMPLGGTISGTVTNSSHGPLKGICVSAAGSDSYAQTTTNAAGRYSIAGLLSGSYQVQFTPDCGNVGNYVGVNYRSAVKASAGKTTAGIDATLPTGATISGTVTSAATGKPLAGICVTIFETDNNQNSLFYGASVKTRANGGYVVSRIPAGTFAALFGGGCGNQGSYAPQAYDHAPLYAPSPITVTKPGEAVTGVGAALRPGVTITGTVRGPRGQRLGGICVVAAASGGLESEAGEGGAEPTAGPTAGFAVTASGTYRLPNLPPGQYQVSFYTGCGNNQNLVDVSFGSQLAPPLISASTGTTSGIDAVMPAAGSVSGSVRSRSGTSGLYSCVDLTGLTAADRPSSGEYFAQGRYTLTGLRPGPYRVAFAPGCLDTGSRYETQWFRDRPSPAGAARVLVRAGKTTTGITSALVAGGYIAGTVTSKGKPVEGMCVFAQNVSQPLDSGSSQSGKGGRYSVEGLNPGRYELSLTPCAPGSGNLAGQVLTRLITVTAPNHTTRFNIGTELAGSISGTVLGGSPAAGETEVCVDAFATNGLGYGQTWSEQGGTYEIGNLLPGKYRVYLNDPSCSGLSYNQAPAWYPAQVVVAAAKVTKLASVTAPANGAISGTVTNTAKHPVSGVCAITTPPVAGSTPVYAVTRGQGGYVLLGLAPGRYKVEFTAGCGATGYRTQWWNRKGSRARATVITVRAGTTATGVNGFLTK